MNKTLIVSRALAEELLTMEECILSMDKTLRDVSAGETVTLQRTMIPQKNGNLFANMASTLHGAGVAGTKVIIFPSAETKKAGTSQGIVPIFDSETGALLSIVDGECITGVRTAATSASATRILAGKDASTLGIFGAGRLGRMHVEAIRLVRPIRRVYVWDQFPEATEALCALVRGWGMEAVPCKTAEEAAVDSDIICTCTKAKEPVLRGSWLRPGTHVNAVGACSASARELDTETILRSRIYVDKTEAALRDGGDLAIPAAAGEWDPSAVVGEVGQVLLGRCPGRQNDQEITVFESVGIAVEDLAAALLIYRKAREQGLGVEVEI